MDNGDNLKSRGLKHIKSKKKYNKKSSAHTAFPKPKPVVLDSNWGRYEQENDEKKIDNSTDFSILANAPITQGSHFQFKSDKVISEEVTAETDSFSELFKLDLNLLDKSLSTIPFARRCAIDEKYFTESQYRIMTTIARNNSEHYFSYLQTIPQDTLLDDLFESSDHEADNKNEDLLDNTDYEETPEQEKECRSEEVIERSSGNNENDLEQWLDTILDD